MGVGNQLSATNNYLKDMVLHGSLGHFIIAWYNPTTFCFHTDKLVCSNLVRCILTCSRLSVGLTWWPTFSTPVMSCLQSLLFSLIVGHQSALSFYFLYNINLALASSLIVGCLNKANAIHSTM